jgi:hypothetical protein
MFYEQNVGRVEKNIHVLASFLSDEVSLFPKRLNAEGVVDCISLPTSENTTRDNYRRPLVRHGCRKHRLCKQGQADALVSMYFVPQYFTTQEVSAPDRRYAVDALRVVPSALQYDLSQSQSIHQHSRPNDASKS